MNPANTAKQRQDFDEVDGPGGPAAPGLAIDTHWSIDRDDGQISRKLAAARAVSQPGAKEPTPLETCLERLLEALNWAGETRHLIDAIPHVDPIDNVEVFKAALKRLGYEAQVSREPLATISRADFPLVVFTRGGPVVATGRDAEGEMIIVGGAAAAETLPEEAPVCRVSRKTERAPEDGPWLGAAARRMRGSLWEAAALSFAITLFAVATPLYSMAVYNYAIGASAADTLVFLTAIVLLALLTEDYLRRLRERLIADIAARLNANLLCDGLAKVLSLPLSKIEMVSVTGQISQLKRFENIQSFFKGPAATTMFDLPFVIVFAITIGVLGGPLVLAPLATVVLFFLLLIIFTPIAQAAERRGGAARRAALELTRETVLAQNAIRAAGAETLWLDRLSADLTAEAQALSRQNVAEQLSAQTAQLLLSIAGVAVLGGGAVLVMNDQLTIGALIAVSILTWRLLTPVQSLFTAFSQIRGVREDLRMFEKLMRLETEAATSAAAKIHRRFDGAIKLDGVGYRPPKAQSFALRNVSVDIEPGERFAVVGRQGSGRTSFLRIALGLNAPTIGQVMLDGLPLTHLDIREIRNAFAFVADRHEFVYGTIAQNMRFANPNATDDEISAMLEALELPLDPARFPDGLRTRLTASVRSELPPSALFKLSLGRALISDKPVLALDAPTENLDRSDRAALLGQLEQLRGRRTVLIASADRSLVKSCDRALLLESGQAAALGPGRAVAAKLSEILS